MSHDQFVYGLRPHPAAWLPVRPPETDEWVRRWGDAEFQLYPAAGRGLPYGQDRLVLILLVTCAVQQRTRKLTLPSAFQMLRLFGLPPSGRNYERWEERMRRVLGTRFAFSMGPLSMGDQVAESSELWYSEPANENKVTLSAPFWEYVRHNYLPLELKVVQALTDSPSTLDFYTWLAARAYGVRPDRYARIPFFGKGGLGDLLGMTNWRDPRDFRKRVRTWVAQVRECWLHCPAVLAEDDDALLVCRVQPPQLLG